MALCCYVKQIGSRCLATIQSAHFNMSESIASASIRQRRAKPASKTQSSATVSATTQISAGTAAPAAVLDDSDTDSDTLESPRSDSGGAHSRSVEASSNQNAPSENESLDDLDPEERRNVEFLRNMVDEEIERVKKTPDLTVWEALKDPSFRYNALREIIGGLILLAIVFAYQYWANNNLRDTGPTHEDLVKMFQKRLDRGDV